MTNFSFKQRFTQMENIIVSNRVQCREALRRLEERADAVRQLIADGVDIRFLKNQLLLLNSNKRQIEALARLDLYYIYIGL
jgi:cell division protein FtsB